MTRKTRVRSGDLRGVSRLAIDATTGVTDLVEAMHAKVAPRILGKSAEGRTRGITGFVYRSVRWVTRLVGGGIDTALLRLAPVLGEGSPSTGREGLLAALNGVLGDHLAASGNALAIPMRLEPGQAPAGGKLLILAHGLCMNDLQWNRKGHDHGAALARDLGYTAVYLQYNSGLHISTNGRAFAERIEALVAGWPVPLQELVILGHSMGGLVARSALHYGKMAGHQWPRHLGKLVFLGTPHHGAALERGGNWVDAVLGVNSYTAPLARLGKIRSAGITDLRHGNLRDEDWEGRDRFERAGDRRQPVSLPEGVECFAMAAVAGGELGSDGLVSQNSALGRHEDPRLDLSIPESRQWVVHGISHFDLLSEPRSYAKIAEWLRPSSAASAA